jgi:hypothetical protein
MQGMQWNILLKYSQMDSGMFHAAGHAVHLWRRSKRDDRCSSALVKECSLIMRLTSRAVAAKSGSTNLGISVGVCNVPLKADIWYGHVRL